MSSENDYLASATSPLADPYSDGTVIKWTRSQGSPMLFDHSAFRSNGGWFLAPVGPYMGSRYSFSDLCVILRREDTSNVKVSLAWSEVSPAQNPETSLCTSRNSRGRFCQESADHSGAHKHVDLRGFETTW